MMPMSVPKAGHLKAKRMNENELREWMERLASQTMLTDDEECDFNGIGHPEDAYQTGCGDGETWLARNILRMYLNK